MSPSPVSRTRKNRPVHVYISVSGIQVKQVRTIDMHPSAKSRSNLKSIFNVAETTFDTHGVATSSRNENAKGEWEVTLVNKVNRPVT